MHHTKDMGLVQINGTENMEMILVSLIMKRTQTKGIGVKPSLKIPMNHLRKLKRVKVEVMKGVGFQ